MRFRWPPRRIGLGAPFNIAFASRETRDRLAPWWMVAAFGVGTTLLLIGLDLLVFDGETLRRLPGIGERPAIGPRLVIVFVGPVLEEFVLRGLIATGVAWLAHWLLSFAIAEPRRAAQWAGTLVAAILAGLFHLGDADGAARVLTLDLVTNAVYGAAYWWRGLELAIATHIIVTAVLLLAVPVLR